MIDSVDLLLMLYFGIGYIVAALVLWFNWLNFKDGASPIIMAIDTMIIIILWGFAVILFIVAWLTLFIIDGSIGKGIDRWVSDQYD